MQHVVIQTTAGEAQVISIKDDPIKAINYAREATMVFISDVMGDHTRDLPESEWPPRPEPVENFSTCDDGHYMFVIEVEEFDWMLTVHPV